MIPSSICTAAPDGTPNVTYLSIVQYVDPTHVAMSFQFFNKSRANIERNPRAQLLVVDPETMRQYRLDLLFERSEQSGPLFDRMNTRLTAIASLTGMSRVFRLRGADVYRVLTCEAVPLGVDAPAHDAGALPPPPSMESVARVTEALSACVDLDALVTAAIHGLREVMGYEHVVLSLVDEIGERLLAVDSGGAAGSGAGAGDRRRRRRVGHGGGAAAPDPHLPPRARHPLFGRRAPKRRDRRRRGHAGQAESRGPGWRTSTACWRSRSCGRASWSACSASRARGRCASATKTRPRSAWWRGTWR